MILKRTRSHHAEKTYDDIIDQGIERAGGSFGLETFQSRAARLNGARAASVFLAPDGERLTE